MPRRRARSDLETALVSDDDKSDVSSDDERDAEVERRRGGDLEVDDAVLLLADDDASVSDADEEVGDDAPGGDAGDLRTTFALWNCMVRSSALAAPWAFTESGLALGVAASVAIGGLMAYTSTLVLRYGVRGKFDDLSAMCGAHLGRWARVGCNVAMALMLAQTVVVFDMMLSTSVYGIVKGFSGISSDNGDKSAHALSTFMDAPSNATNSSDWSTCSNAARDFAKCWNPFTAVVVTGVALMLLGAVRNLDGFVAVSVAGPFFMTYLIFFIVFKSVVAEKPVMPISPYANFSTFAKTTGFLTNCMFSHHAIIPVCRANSKSKNNVRNLLMAYALTLVSYLAPAVAGNFSAAYVAVRTGPNGSSRAANFLRVYPANDYYTLSAHIAMTVQFLTMVPLLLYILRVQVAGLLPSVSQKYENIVATFINASVITLGSLCAAHPGIDIGFILSKAGGLFGLIFAYAAPVLVHIFGRRGRQHPLWNHLLHGGILAVGVAVAVSQFVPT